MCLKYLIVDWINFNDINRIVKVGFSELHTFTSENLFCQEKQVNNFIWNILVNTWNRWLFKDWQSWSHLSKQDNLIISMKYIINTFYRSSCTDFTGLPDYVTQPIVFLFRSRITVKFNRILNISKPLNTRHLRL